MRRALAAALALGVLLPSPAAAQDPDAVLRRALGGAMGSAGPAAGAYVLDADDGRPLYSRRARAPRTLASNAKLFTTAAALERMGPETTLSTRVLGRGELEPTGRWRGDLVLRGGGDPTFGTRPTASRLYRASGGLEDLAAQLAARGVRRVSGRVRGDETLFDALRGGPDSGFLTSRWVGPLSALAVDRGRAPSGGWVADPPVFAAARLHAQLERLSVPVRARPARGSAPSDGPELATVTSPPLARLVEIANKRSDNFFAEMLLKQLAAREGEAGTTAAGAREAMLVAGELGASAQIADGSGLSRANRATPEQVARLLDGSRERPWSRTFRASLPVAGRDGTLRDRMRRGEARGRCRAKTGSLAGISTLSGYCRSRGGDLLVFSFLMERVNVPRARRLQDRMVEALARYEG